MTTATIATAQSILKSQFGYDAFRHNQQDAIQCILNHQDCLVLMPTGGGKSLCYQIPALMLDGLTVVVSPLIALMKDQVDALRANGVQAEYLNSTQSSIEQKRVVTAVRDGSVKLLYVAPERIMHSSAQFFEFLESVRVSLFAIDEAHCISSWGHDFRPEYMQLGQLKKRFAHIPLIALTATADDLVRRDIVERLHIESAPAFVSSFNRPNIYYRVEPKRNTYAQLFKYLQDRRDESGIIYCLSRKTADGLAADLRADGFSALAYHAGLDKEVRELHQEQFLKDEVKIMVATIAFGMGIDKSNVRFVVHYDLPKNIESYYQETGRAGRDGLQSEALLFFSAGDVMKLRNFAMVEDNAEQSQIMLKKLSTMAQYGELKSCRRKFLLDYFSERGANTCGHCDNCHKTHATFDGTLIAQKALSAVVRTEQRMGLTYLVDFLRGAKTQKIWDKHKALKTYGIGADISKEDWFAYFRDLLAQGYLAQSDGQYPSMILTEKSRAVLKGEATVTLYEIERADAGSRKKSKLVAESEHAYNEALFETLRSVRTELARTAGVPPFVVFSDASLIDMATYLPLSEDDMHHISGVGEVKYQRYGETFLTAIQQFCQAHSLDTLMHLKSKRAERTPANNAQRNNESATASATASTSTFKVSLALFKSGKNAAQIAQERGLSVGTIEGHLARFIQSGEIALNELLTPEKAQTIREALAQIEYTGALSPIKEHLGDGFTYGEIRAVLVDMGWLEQ